MPTTVANPPASGGSSLGALGVIGAIANPIGSIISAIGQHNTNKVNLHIAKEQINNQRELANQANALNYRMFKEQNDWNLKQWQRENEYNSATSQVARLKAAGINPAYADLGPGQSAVGVSSAPWHGAEYPQLPPMPQMLNPLSDVGDAARSELEYLVNIRKIKQEEKRIANETRLTDAQIKQADANIRFINANASNVEQLTPVQYKEVVQRIKNLKSEKDYKDIDIKYRRAEYRILQAQEKYLKDMPRLQRSMLINQIAGLKNENQFNSWIRKRSIEDGLSPVANSAVDALCRHIWSAVVKTGKSPTALIVQKEFNRIINSKNLFKVLRDFFGF